MQDNPYLPLAQKDAEQGVRASMLTAIDKQPDSEAKLQDLARRYNMPVEAVRLNRPEVERRAAFEAIDYETLARELPATSSFLSDPNNAAIAHDDVDNLGAIERTLRNLPSAGLSGLLSASSGVVGALQAPVELVAPLLDPLAGTILPENPLRRVAGGLSRYRESIGNTAEGWMPQAEGTVERGIYSGVGSLSRNLAALPLALAPGGQRAALTAMTAPVAGGEFGEARDAGLAPIPAATYGASQAAIEYATEKIPVSRLIGDLATNTGFGKLLLRQLAAEVPGEQAATILQDLNEWAVLKPEATFTDYLKDRPGAAAETLIATIVGVGGQTTIMKGLDSAINRVERQAQKAQQAEQIAERMAELGQMIKADKVLQRNPQAFEQLIAKATEDGPVPTVYIDAQVLQQSGVADQLREISPAVAEQFEEASQTGGTVAIPVEEFAARIAPTDLAQGLLEHIRTAPDGFSRAEAQAYMQSQADQLQVEVDLALAQQEGDTTWHASQDAVKAQIQQELDILGRFDAFKNEADATLFASYYSVRAAQLGMTPEQFYDQRRVRFAAQELSGRVFNQGGVQLASSEVQVKTGESFRISVSQETFGMGQDRRPALLIETRDPVTNERRGLIDFDVRPDGVLVAENVKVAPAMRGKGIAEAMYRAAVDAGYRVAPGRFQTQDGAAMVQRLQAKGLIEPGEINLIDVNAPPSGGVFNQQARGSFSPETFTISLLKGADLSTALHEGAHFFFENDIMLASELVAQNESMGADTMSPGERQIVADVSALLKWHGIEGTVQEQLAQWYQMDFEQKRVAHERTAEGFEAYLFEGKAPSLELAPYFQKFRAWMISVYKSLKQFLAQNPEAGKLDDTVRQVFDRMLATSEQITLAEQGRSMLPLFATPEEAGMSVDEFAAYQAQATQPTADAIQDLQARGLRDLQWIQNARGREIKKLQKQAAARRAETRIEARRQIMSQPVYQAWQFLTGKLSKGDRAAVQEESPKTGRTLNPETDSLFQAIAKLGGLDRMAVEKAWGWSTSERTPQPGFGQPLLRRENGLSIDAMAELLQQYGYLSNPADATPDFDVMAEFEAKFDAEYRGDVQYSIEHDYARSMGERRAGDGVDFDVLTAARFELLALKDMGLPPTIPEIIEGLGMTARDGIHPDLIAERFGFSSGDELVRTLAIAEKPAEAIETLTDQMMLERYGDLATPEAIERAADSAIHNAARARMVATEANALAEASGGRKVLVEAAREFARATVARVKVKNLQPSQYANAAARASANAIKASRAGDIATAAAEKRNQLVQTLAAREAFDARDEVDELRRSWSALANRADDKLRKTYDLDLVNAVRAILANVGIAEARGKRAMEYLDSLRQYDPTMYEAISQSVTAAESLGKPFKEMTVEEVRGLADEIEAILHLAKRSRQMEVAGNLMDREEIEAELQVRMQEIGVPESMPGKGSAITPGEQRMAKFKTFIAAARRVENWAGAMDGSQQMGPFRRYVFGVVKDAADRYRTDKTRYLKQFRDLFDAVAPTLKPQIIHAPELGYTFGKDSGGSAINEILHAILHTGNASNKRKLLLGRGWAVERENGVLDTSRWDAFINRMAAEGKLQKEHFDFAQGVWDMLESIKPLAQKTHRDVFGKYFDEITAEPLQTPFGVYAGGYVPAMADSRIVTDAKLRKLQEDENAGMSYAFPTTPTGFTKARVEYNRPLMLDLRTLAQHIDKVLLFAHMTGPVRDVQKVLTGIGGTLDKLDSSALDGMLVPWLSRAARQQVTTPIPADANAMRFFSTMRSRAGMAAMFGNVVNTAQQITGFSIAAVKVKPRLMMSAAADMIKGPKAFIREVAEASPYMASRLDNEVAAMNDQINEILLNPSLLERGEQWTSRHAYFLQSAVDSWMSPIVWKGAYDQAMENGATHEDAVKLGDSAVRETQGSSLPEDVSRIETGNAFVRLFTQFAGYFNMQANLMGTEFVKIARDMGLRSGAGRGLYVLFLAFLAPAVVSELIVQVARGGPGDDDDDGYLDDWLSAVFVWGPMRNATAMIPGVGQGINAVVNATNDKPYDDRLATSPAISMLEATARAPYSAYRAVVDEGSPQRAVRDVATLISMTVGLPATLAARPIGYLAGVEDGRIEPSGPVDAARGLVTGSPGRQ